MEFPLKSLKWKPCGELDRASGEFGLEWRQDSHWPNPGSVPHWPCIQAVIAPCCSGSDPRTLIFYESMVLLVSKMDFLSLKSKVVSDPCPVNIGYYFPQCPHLSP